MKLGFETLPYIINSCKKTFEKEPVLENAIGMTCKYVIRRNGKSVLKYLPMKLLIPYWRIAKKGFKNNQITYYDIDNRVTHNLFSFNLNIDHYFGIIFPVMKKMDEMGLHSILFTTYKIYSKHKKEIDSLKNNIYFVIEYLPYDLTYFEIIKCSVAANRLFNKLLKETDNNEVVQFIKKHKNEIIFNTEEILVYAKAISKIIQDKKCGFHFSLGGFFGINNACKRYGIKSIMIQHGNFGNVENHVEYTVQPPECSPHADDEIIVWGEISKNKVKHLFGYGSERKIIPLGNPMYDSFTCAIPDKNFYTKLNLNSEKKTVVFFSQSHIIDSGEQPSERFIEPIYALDKLLESRISSKINLVVKLHPCETRKYYKKHMRNLDKITIVKDEVTSLDLYQHADVSVTVSSTTTLEAMIFGIPTIQFVLPEYGIRGDCYYKDGASILVNNEYELIETITDILSDEYNTSVLKAGQKKYLENNLVNLGSATDKIVEHLQEVKN